MQFVLPPTPAATETLLPEALTAMANSQNLATLDTAIINATQRAVSMSRLAESLSSKGFIQSSQGSFL